MDSSKLLIVGGVVLGGFYLFNKNKKDTENAKALLDAQALALANAQSQTPPVQNLPAQTAVPVEDLTGFYTPAEATKKALEVVTKWVSLLDAIPKEVLTQENKNTINQRIWEEKAKQDKIDYDKALNLAKSKNEATFKFGDATYYTQNQEDVRNGSFVKIGMITAWKPNPNNWSIQNQFSSINSSSLDAIRSATSYIGMGLASVKNSTMNLYQTLGDYVKYAKTQEFSKVYDMCKDAFTKIPKSDVNRLVVLLPKYLMAQNDNFAYFQSQYLQNPFTIEEQLYLKDINIEELLSAKKPMLPNNFFYGQSVETIKTPIFATASLIQSAR
jgi:hypothetical protein